MSASKKIGVFLQIIFVVVSGSLAVHPPTAIAHLHHQHEHKHSGTTSAAGDAA